MSAPEPTPQTGPAAPDGDESTDRPERPGFLVRKTAEIRHDPRQYDDPTVMAGRPFSAYVHWVLLAAAIGADIGAFYQVVDVVMPHQSESMLLFVTVGFAAVVIYLAHTAGTVMRDRAEGRGRSPFWFAPLCIVVWLAFGLFAFHIRRTVDPEVGAATQSQFNTPDGTAVGTGGGTGGDEHLLLGAVMFAVLYVGAGMVAALGAYFTHNPLHGKYYATVRTHRRAVGAAARESEDYYRALAEHATWTEWIKEMDGVLAEQREQRRRFADELKAYARHRIAEKAQDPAITDSLFQPTPPSDSDPDPALRP